MRRVSGRAMPLLEMKKLFWQQRLVWNVIFLHAVIN
jgi:hypothetical protein